MLKPELLNFKTNIISDDSKIIVVVFQYKNYWYNVLHFVNSKSEDTVCRTSFQDQIIRKPARDKFKIKDIMSNKWISKNAKNTILEEALDDYRLVVRTFRKVLKLRAFHE